MVIEVPERPLAVGDVDMLGAVEHDARCKTLADHAIADNEIGDDLVWLALADARTDAPGQEFGIALDVGHEVEELLGRVGKPPTLGVRRHQPVDLTRWPRALPRARRASSGNRRLQNTRIASEATPRP